MPVYELGRDIAFPPVELSTREGILAIGGDLRPDRLLEAYRRGIFPWYSEPEPILWWSPDPRCILFPHEAVLSESMRKILKKGTFHFTADTRFRDVMISCAKDRRNKPGTWITEDILEAYCELHRLGFAHSIEAWRDGKLAGGLYGVSLGSIFIGESMFHFAPNASKAAFLILCRRLSELGFMVVDCQVYSPHLGSLGAWELPRRDYLKLLKLALEHETRGGSWNPDFEGRETVFMEASLHKRSHRDTEGTERKMK